ncbi:cytochrome b5 [Calliphora vicina]|uniref:cytochrome b5 n=1 Tax=Calliphora vicina TaxID=7373 RepID=UPI00325ACD7A
MSQTFTLCEISENNGKNGKPVWIVVKGVVYDVTNFLKDHPGGDELILEYAGKDATKAFNDAGHSIDAIQDMKLYKIGIVDNQCSQQCVISTISTTESKKLPTETTMDQQQCCKEKKRLKLFFCF